MAIDRITLDDWIARHDADLGQLWSGTAADQSWIEDQLTALANDPWIQACARARRDIEEFRLGFDDDLTGRLMDGLEADERDDFLRTYFSRDPQFRDSLTDFAARTIYDACRNSTPAAAESAETAAGSNAVAQDRAKDLPTAVEVGTEAADSTELPPAGDGPDAASPDDLLGTELNDNSMVEEVDQAREADQVEKADPSADNQSSAGEDPVDGTVPDPVPDPTEGTGPYEASEAAGLERGTAEEDREPANRRAEVLATIHRLAEQNRTGMVLHVDGKAPQSVDRVRTTELFSLMIDRVQEKGSVPAQLTWNGVPIGVQRTAGERLQILVGPAEAQVDIPLRHAWPPVAERGELLGKLVSYINTTGERAEATRQSPRTTPRPTTVRAPQAAGPSARHAFPAPPVKSSGGAPGRPGPLGPDSVKAAATPVHRR